MMPLIKKKKVRYKVGENTWEEYILKMSFLKFI